MYWLYVILFVCSLIIPGLYGRGWLPQVGDRETTEIVFVFVFSTLAFVLYIIRDYQLLRYKKDLEEKRREVSRLTKELLASYSYIGEVNRKFEILQDVTLEIPELLEKGGKGGKNMYYDVLHAIQIFSGCVDFVVVFYSLEQGKNLAEVCLPNSALVSVPNGVDVAELIRDHARFTKNNGNHSVIQANGTIANIHCLGIFQRTSLRNDVVDLVRPLLMQALFLHVYSKKDVFRGISE